MQQQEIIQAVQNSVAEVFSTMLGAEIRTGEMRSDHASPRVNEGIMAFVGIAGPWVGNGIIRCSAGFACRLCEALIITQASAVNEEVLDAVGEIANMIIGNFKTAAEAAVGPLALGVPTVIYGRNFTSKSVGSNDWLVLPFFCFDEEFEVRLWFAPAPQASTLRHGGAHLQAI